MVTLTHIANRAGVSVSTVSAVLNGSAAKRRISRKRVNQVQAAAEALGYRPNAAAQAMQAGCFKTILYLRSEHLWRSWMTLAMLEGVERILDDQGYKLMLGRMTDAVLQNRQDAPSVLRNWSADGILMNYIVDIPQEVYEILKSCAVPTIWMNVNFKHDAVYFDDFHMARESVLRHYEMGHRMIAFYSQRNLDTCNGHYSAQARLNGYLKGISDLGLEAFPIAEQSSLKEDRGYHLMVQRLSDWQRREERPSAIIANGENEACACLDAIRTVGMRPGKDLSLSSIFALDEAKLLGHRISGYALPIDALCKDAVEMLLQKIAAPKDPVLSRSSVGTWRDESATLGTGPYRP